MAELFSVAVVDPRPWRLRVMHNMYGLTEGQTVQGVRTLGGAPAGAESLLQVRPDHDHCRAGQRLARGLGGVRQVASEGRGERMSEITKDEIRQNLARRLTVQLDDYRKLPPITPQLERMHQAYTEDKAHTCGECGHCRKLQANARLCCELYLHETHKPAAWQEEWAACGMWVKVTG